MPNSFNLTLHQDTISESNPGYITDNVIPQEAPFTPAEITLNPTIFNPHANDDVPITNENIIIAKNKLIDTLTKTNRNLIKTITSCSMETVDINNYIESLSEKISDNKRKRWCTRY